MTPPTTTFSPAHLANTADPYALLAEVLAEGRALRSDGSWIIAGHAECLAVLAGSSSRSGFVADLYRAVLPPGAAREEMSHRINFLDPPDHPRVRRLVSKAFTPRRVNTLREYVGELCRELLAPLAGDSPVDLIPSFSHQVPSLVISELLGVPPEDRDRLTELADSVSRLLGAAALAKEQMDAACEAAEQMHGYLRALFEERSATPRDDLISALIAVEEEGERLSESERLSLAATLYSAGHRTTRDLFSNGVSVLLGDTDLTDAVRAGEIPYAAVVSEFLRYETPTHYVVRMFAEPTTIGEAEVPAGEAVVALLAAGNRDPEAYERPERFDPRRWMAEPEPPAPLSFAFGPHFCLGASLARMEAEVMLEALLTTFPELTPTDEPPRHWHTGLFRGLEALPVIPGAPAAG